MFESARIRLTAWYTIVILVVSCTISMLFYHQTVRTLRSEYIRIENRLERRAIPQVPRPAHHQLGLEILQEDLESAQRQIARHLIFINGAIVVFVAGAGYVLSGKTLKPIEHALREQRRFVADASHELRTPITALKTGLEVSILDTSLPRRAKKVLKEHLEDVKSLELLASSLLRLASFDERESIVLTDVNISAVVRKAVKHASALAKQKNITLHLHRLPRRTVVTGDAGALLDLILVFLDNAIKYSPTGSTVSVALTHQKKAVSIGISDEGVGIASEHLPHIFDRFYRVDDARVSDKTGGYGLGLSVARKILDVHAGTVQVESEEGAGTTFTIQLPQNAR